jgi:hypothetical protein
MQTKIEMRTHEILSLDELRDSRLELLPDRIELRRRHGRRDRHNRHFFDHNHDRYDDNRYDDNRYGNGGYGNGGYDDDGGGYMNGGYDD